MVRAVADELTGQLIVLDRYLAGVVEAINDAEVAALTGHGQAVAARFGGEFVPVADPDPAPAVSSSTSTARVDTAWLVGLFGVVATIVMAGAR